jgi:hypothetical protein
VIAAKDYTAPGRGFFPVDVKVLYKQTTLSSQLD